MVLLYSRDNLRLVDLGTPIEVLEFGVLGELMVILSRYIFCRLTVYNVKLRAHFLGGALVTV
jgi:hypothetical protein